MRSACLGQVPAVEAPANTDVNTFSMLWVYVLFQLGIQRPQITLNCRQQNVYHNNASIHIWVSIVHTFCPHYNYMECKQVGRKVRN